MVGPPERRGFARSATTLAGLLTLAAFAYEAIRDRGAQSFAAFAAEPSLRLKGGATLTEVEFVRDGRPTRATLRAWFLHLRPGDEVHVMVPAGPLDEVRLGGFWPDHFFSFSSLCILTAVAIVDVLHIPSRRHRTARESFLVAPRPAAADPARP